MCSYETKIVIARSVDNLNGHPFATSKCNGHDTVDKNSCYLVVSILFVAIYHLSCSDEFVYRYKKT